MSAFVSMVHAQGAHLFTDGAVWNGTDQTLVDIRTKVTVSKLGQIAVTSKGDMELGDRIAREICERADILGADAVLSGLQGYADGLRERLGIIDGTSGLHVLVVGFVEGRGGAHRIFRTHDEIRSDGNADPAYTVTAPAGSVYWSGTRFKADEIGKFGLHRQPDEDPFAHIERMGIGILDVMRYRPGRSRPDGPLDIWCIGGGIDVTTLNAAGAKTNTYDCGWSDVIGEKIDPFRGETAGERRRLERLFA